MADGDEEDCLLPGFPISHQISSCSTLPEYHSVLSLLHQLDHLWFRDNVLSAPGFRSCLPFRPPSPPPQCPSSSLQIEPFRSIELVQFSNSGSSVVRKSITSELPCTRFEKLHSRRAAEKAPDSRSAHRSAQRKQLKQLGEIRVLVPRHQLSETLFRDRTAANGPVPVPVPVAAPASDLGRVLHVGIDRRIGNCEPSSYKGNQIVGKARSPKLQMTTSGNHLKASLSDSQQPEISVKRRIKREMRRSSKSTPDLEVDELQGFKDLGFHLGKDDLTPCVVNMLPALRCQLGGHVEGERSPAVRTFETKPHWSEAWLIRRPASPLLNWRIPVQADEGSNDMKEHLKFWARAVASTVRQEC